MFDYKKILLTLLVVLFALAPSAHAVLQDVGPVNPANGFPVWYSDTAGTALEQCNFSAIATDPNCIPGGPAGIPIPGIDFEEAFWWAAETVAPNQGNVSNTLLVLALEAAFGTGEPVAGQQVVFGRIRVRIDVSAPGAYTVTHPYGSKVYNITAADVGIRAINDTIDIGVAALDFAAALAAPIGPFLKCVTPAPPAGYLGNFATACTVTGSPFGTNFFRITGPGTNTSTSLFNVSGKLFTGTTLNVQRATYERTAAGAGQVDIFATSTPGATVDVSGGAAIPVTPLSGDADGFFFAHVPLADARGLSATVTVTANRGLLNQAQVITPLSDIVSITKAQYDTTFSRLTVEAASSDQFVAQALNVSEFVPGTMTQVPGSAIKRLVVNGLTAPPPSITVASSAGGQDSVDVAIVTALAPVITSVPVTTATGGQLYSYQVIATDPNPGDALTYSLNASPAGMTIDSATGLVQWATPALAGVNAVTVRATDTTGLFATQTFDVTVSVLPPTGQAPTITSLPITNAITGQLYTYQMTATDPTPADVLTFALDAPVLAGMTINSATGLIQWTPSLLQTGPRQVTARVTDSGGLFATQTFTVNVGVNALNNISGTVIDSRSGAPLPGVSITLLGPVNLTATTDAAGRYSFTGLSNGVYEVIPSLAGFRFNPISKDVDIRGVSRTQNFKGESRAR